MAKQNVSFGERHLEKLVIGVAGGVLAATIFFYVVQDPYTVAVGGTSVGPAAFYNDLDKAVSGAASSLKNATPPNNPEKKWTPPPLAQKASGELATVFVPLAPPVPNFDTAIQTGGKLDLVEIMPPAKPVLTTGRGMAQLEPATVQVLDEPQSNAGQPSQEAPEPKGTAWVAAFSTLGRRAQQADFIRAKYAVDRQQLMVVRVEAERQRLLPNGGWEEPPQQVVPFETLALRGRDVVPLTGKGSDAVVNAAGQLYIEALKKEAREQQAAILRPNFQSVIAEPVAWKVPQVMPGNATYDWQLDYQVTLPQQDQQDNGKPEAIAPRVDYKKVTAQVESLVAEGKYIEAEKLLSETAASKGLLPRDATDAKERLTQLEPRVRQALAEQEAARAKRLQEQELLLGADVDPMWLTDVNAQPGETYRYRLRVWVVNPYAGVVAKLRQPEDAAKVMLASAWSDWSDPVYLEPVEHFFVTNADASDSVKFSLYQWNNGEWQSGAGDVALGEPVRFTKQLQEFVYDGVVADVELNRPYAERSAERNRVRYMDEKGTPVVTLVKANGEVEEHLLLKDRTTYRDLRNELMKRPTAGQPRAGVGVGQERDTRRQGGGIGRQDVGGRRGPQ